MRAFVDPDRCMSAGYCAQVSPAVFAVDPEAGHAVVRTDPVPPGDAEDVREAETLCPNIAIRVED